MAVTNTQSAQILNVADRIYPVEKWGKLRFAYFDVTQGAAAGDANSTFELCDLPPGRIRLLPQLSLISWTAFGVARVMDIGHLAYIGESQVTVAADYDAIATGIDVAAADADGLKIGALIKWDFFSMKGVRMAAQVRVDTIPAAARVIGYFIYVDQN
jgi:hypothetical protein